MIKFLVVVVLVAIIAISAVDIVDNNRSINYGGYNSFSSSPFLTLTANITHPSPQANFTYGYVSPGLWGFQSGEGNASMFLYRNSSILESVSLKGNEYLNVFAYSSEHLTQNIPMPIQDVYRSNLSSFVSFKVINMSSNVLNDLAYDMFLGSNGTLQNEIEIMLFDNIDTVNAGSYLLPTGLSLITHSLINGIPTTISWNLYEKTSDSSSSQEHLIINYIFIPSNNLFINDSGKAIISISSFLEFLNENNLVFKSQSILRLGIGTEFEIGAINMNAGYSFWLYSYFIIDGTDYQVVQK